MSNRLFQAMGNIGNPYAQLTREINKFAQSINGNPQQMVQRLLDTGEMSQAEFNRLSQVVRQIAPFIGKH